MSTRTGRKAHELRPIELTLDAAPYAEGSCLVAFGNTHVLCAASVEEGLPSWRKESGMGWVTGEYAMLPRATHTRSRRERQGAKGRTREIERLIGRSLRAVVDYAALGPRTVTVDCDVLQADGGTRTAAITGGFVALSLAMDRLIGRGELARSPLLSEVAAVSVGLVDGQPLLDLEYNEDVRADVDMNVVALAGGRLVEVQGTAEGHPFDRDEHDALLDLALAGIDELLALQAQALSAGQ
ncbi:MAG: ribonuclease PH [Gemmatimonadetes bacterium]|nr:ribonuclease PH [Gemmatimonadota bacterium]